MHFPNIRLDAHYNYKNIYLYRRTYLYLKKQINNFFLTL